MKFKNAIEIHLDNVVLLGNKENFKMQGYDNKFLETCHWSYLKQEPTKLFCLYRTIIEDPIRRGILDKEIFNSNVKVVDLKGSIYKELDRIFRDNINKFIEKNINNISYLFDDKADDYYSIGLSDMGIDLREKAFYGVDENIEILLNNFKYKDIANGLIELSTRTGDNHFIFDMKTMKFEDSDLDIFKNVYHLYILEKFLAYEQYKSGITPPFYNEVAKINKFLEGKKMVTLLFNDGYEKQVPAQISQILATNHKKFWINTQVNDMNINNFRAIRYGKKELDINTKNLIPLQKQLDKIIKTKENDVICNIGEQEIELAQ